jgi:hypothetical protein
MLTDPSMISKNNTSNIGYFKDAIRDDFSSGEKFRGLPTPPMMVYVKTGKNDRFLP